VHRLHRGRLEREPRIQLATTSDIAFLLLIFFIATAIFVSPAGLPLVLAPAGASARRVVERDLATVRLGAAGEITAGGERRTPEALAAWAQTVQTERPGAVFSVEVDGRCPYEGVVRALDALRGAAVERIGFSLVEEG
jgi:biopolymer transport protein ExbD